MTLSRHQLPCFVYWIPQRWLRLHKGKFTTTVWFLFDIWPTFSWKRIPYKVPKYDINHTQRQCYSARHGPVIIPSLVRACQTSLWLPTFEKRCLIGKIELQKGHLQSQYRVAQEKRERHTSLNSPEKNDTKITNFGSVFCFLGHILWDNVETPNVPFSA